MLRARNMYKRSAKYQIVSIVENCLLQDYIVLPLINNYFLSTRFLELYLKTTNNIWKMCKSNYYIGNNILNWHLLYPILWHTHYRSNNISKMYKCCICSVETKHNQCHANVKIPQKHIFRAVVNLALSNSWLCGSNLKVGWRFVY